MMETETLFLFLTLILSNNHIIKHIEATSNDGEETPAPSKNSSRLGINERLLLTHPEGIQSKVYWTPKLNADLLEIWDTTNPEDPSGHAHRIHDRWSVLHSEYSHLTPGSLKRHAESMILRQRRIGAHENDEKQQMRLQILNTKKQFQWTPEFKKDLMACYYASDPKSKGQAVKMHGLWAQLHPEFARLEPRFLIKTASRFMSEMKKPRTQEDPGERVSKAKIPWDMKLRAELMDIWDRTYDPDLKRGHTKKIFEEWSVLHPEWSNVSSLHLKSFADTLIDDDTIERLSRGEDNERLRMRMEFLKRNEDRIKLTPEVISSFLKCWDIKCEDERYRMWKRLQPEYANIDLYHINKYARKYSKKIEGPWRHCEKGKDVMRQYSGKGKEVQENISQEHEASSSRTPRPNWMIRNQYSAFPSYHHESSYPRHDKNLRILSNPQQQVAAHADLHQRQWAGQYCEQGASSSQKLIPDHQEVGAISKVTPRLDSRTLPHYIRQFERAGHHQGRGTSINHIADPKFMFRNQQMDRRQESGRQLSHQEPSKERESRENEHDLDLSLHLK